MKPTLVWTTALLAGVAALAAYPVLAQEAGAAAGFHPAQLLVPVGFLVLLSGAAGLFLTWCASPASAE
ncbi:hypothetical protein P1J78_11725 [Psychromarinibacter sp. C21-152]|uniref:Uncharacterized protein n=1 Tax=Psychromarinibacter sediminicola TaxID=3033385 RepID=A0AAE3T926_9RHOB|nr:hypothetical protein [Psychromarinibacter sediminicola]MDF0601403.1 hypothetical protein [Psychromarinibacter sediminicola]